MNTEINPADKVNANSVGDIQIRSAIDIVKTIASLTTRKIPEDINAEICSIKEILRRISFREYLFNS